MSLCLVTGGAGFIGSHLTEKLLNSGHSVRVLDNFSTGHAKNLRDVQNHPNLSLINGSITDQRLIIDAVRDVDVIYHLAAAVGVKLVAEDPLRTIETNIYPTQFLLTLASQSGARFFLASTSEVYGKNPKEKWTEEDDSHFGPTSRPRWAYGCSKAIDEFLSLAYHSTHGLKVTIGRFFNVVGPRQVGNYGMVIPRFIDQAMQGESLKVYDDGEQIRCFAHVDQVADTVIQLTNCDAAIGKIFNIGSDQPVSIRELAEEVIRRVNPALQLEFLSYQKAYGDGFEDVRRRVPDTSRLRETIGSTPSMQLGEILDDIIRWKKTQY